MVFRILTIILLGVVVGLTNCTKDRELPSPKNSNQELYPIKINELVVKGSAHQNEFNSSEDWIELYNNSDTTVVLAQGEWYITDDAVGNPLQYSLPQITLAPRGYYVIWCDGLDTVANDVHTNFRLSSGGEHIGLFYLSSTNKIDDYQYPAQPNDNESFARIPDGSNNWGRLTTPTPGASN